jgi:hypothetical protein
VGEEKRVEMVDIEGGEEGRRRGEQGKFEQALSRESFFHYFGGMRMKLTRSLDGNPLKQCASIGLKDRLLWVTPRIRFVEVRRVDVGNQGASSRTGVRKRANWSKVEQEANYCKVNLLVPIWQL